MGAGVALVRERSEIKEVEMRLRRVESVWVLAGVFVVGLMAPGPAAGQAASADAKTGSALRTPWGDPALQGVWTGSTLTPL